MILFFDIDGTLWDGNNHIPKSAVESIQKARKNGHKVFLNSGRSRAFIQNPKLFEIGLDGIVSACGTMIEYNGETVYQRRIDPEMAVFSVELVYKYDFQAILEGAQYLYLEEEEFRDDAYGAKVISEMQGRLKGIRECWGEWDIQKFSCKTDTPHKNECFAKLHPYYEILSHSPTVAEMVPKGFHKGKGIEEVCELLGEDIKNTVAFGDSINDMDMIRTAGIGVAMGNGTTDIKEAANYITTSLMEDGIANALRHLELL